MKHQVGELGIQPDYLAVAGMEEVFRRVRNGDAEVGLVNSWYGRQHAAQFDLRASQVVVRPSLLYIAASPAAASLLPIIDTYLAAWKQDAGSPYHQAMDRWLDIPDEQQLSHWLAWALGVALFLMILTLFLGMMLRKMVRKRTAALEEKRAQLDHIAHHDPLTGLPNRLLFFDRLKQGIRQSRRSGKNLALLFLDLDQFKQINDTFGHAVGDQLLQEVAGRLRQATRETDTVARIGDDEFAVIMGSLDEPADVVVGIRHLHKVFADPFTAPGQQFAITLSIGVSIYPQDGGDAETLLRNADTAMFRAKDEGRNTYQLYDREMTRETVERARVETFLRAAVENGEIEVCYQPMVSLESGHLIGLEALARWHHADLGEVPPDRFIPLAEESGLMLHLGRQVLDKACAQVASWRAKGFDTGAVAVNLSGKQLGDPSLIEMVSHAIQRNGCEPQLLEFEVTEDFVMRRVDESVATMRRLRSIGIELAIDDFGTGYSSLAYLKMLPVSRLKIDRSFIAGIPSDEDDMAIVKAVIALG
ncbi:MAG TPA: EAL domain-containing protein, partial [Chromatiaceae bacterium]|nr:EAL domain-containing protein [Chromatiaceae bacterium]